MLVRLRHLLGWVISAFCPRGPLFGEPRPSATAAGFARKAASPSTRVLDQLFWVTLRRVWSGWGGSVPNENSCAACSDGGCHSRRRTTKVMQLADLLESVNEISRMHACAGKPP